MLTLTENLLEHLSSEIDASTSTQMTQSASQMTQSATQMTQNATQMTQRMICDVWRDILRRKLRIVTQLFASSCVSQALTIAGGLKKSVDILKKQVRLG